MSKQLYKDYMNKKYYSNLYSLFLIKLIGQFLKKGNKEKALKLLFELKYIIKQKSKKEPIFILLYSLLKSLFKFYFIKKRLGSSIKEIPMPLLKTRQVRIATKNLFKLAYSKNKRSVSLTNLNNIILNAFKRKGLLIRLNNVNYRKALENRVLLFLIRK